MTRLLLSLIFSLFLCAGLVACHVPEISHMDMNTPRLEEARYDAAYSMHAMQTGRTDIAVEKLEAASQEAPNDPLVLAAWGYLYEKAGDLDKANSYYSNAMIQAGRSGTMRNIYGAFLCRNGYPLDSIRHFMKAAEVPHYSEADYAMANARYCAALIKHGLGDNDEYAYYTRLVWTKNPQSSQQ